MFAGFDYGTSNCALGVIRRGEEASSEVKLLGLDRDSVLLPSNLYALDRSLVCEYVAGRIADPDARESYLASRPNAAGQAQRARRELSIGSDEQVLCVGRQAVDLHIEAPDEGFYIKSPKSFLGSGGLSRPQLDFIEDVVTAMMIWAKSQAEANAGAELSQAVIGRPVNYQGADSDAANRQAMEIMTSAAQRAGFKDFEFMYEPLAAGVNFESRMQQDQVLLVVDIGGGTTDCSMVRMGPSHRNNDNRSDDFLAHCGQRTGGNDLDIYLTYKGLMPLFGLGTDKKSGLTMPTQPFWSAIEINNVRTQAEFSAWQTRDDIAQLCRDAKRPELLNRLLLLQEGRKSYQLVRSGEQAKIELSDADAHEVNLDYIEKGLSQPLDRAMLGEAIQNPLNRIIDIVHEALKLAQCRPDLVYLTGGSGKSPVIRAALEQELGEIPVVDGDFFGSVAAGLTQWAAKIYR
ncbi:molecular chaperone [Hahella sp. CR1]|uniref:molecular chaperone n=1 Tax=Hahella sp. CR1 TaxID=2992807 RepID=UPI002442EDA9|nr:molecular chaperone [Hahella sp. CR1]MDG9667235.1 molecular chaperone [Hahella sp. CR1]